MKWPVRAARSNSALRATLINLAEMHIPSTLSGRYSGLLGLTP